MKYRRIFRVCSCALLAGAVLGCGHAPPPQPKPIQEVSVSLPIVKEVIDYQEFTGRTDAVETVDVQARVSGYLVKVNFKEGDLVEKDDVLYEIDPRPFQADLDRAKGEVERLEAQKKLVAIQVDRYQKLALKGAASQQDLDQYLGQQAENIGSLKAAKANAERADLNLKFCTIASPINGRISRTRLTPGNLVNADTTLLTTIVSIDPMYAYFNVDEPILVRTQKLIRAGKLKSKELSEIQVGMGLVDDVTKQFPHHGVLNFINNQFDPLTGTIQVRGIFPNPDKSLTPGMFVRVRLSVGVARQGVLVTERAIGTDQGQKYLYVVDADNKVQYRRVRLGMLFDGLRAIEEGLEPKERVIVNGLQRVRTGDVVKPELVEMASQPLAQ